MTLNLRSVVRGAALVLGIAVAVLLGIVAHAHDPSPTSPTSAGAAPATR